MKMIASADNNWAIGYKGSLLAHVSADMKFFKSKTVGNVVILGRKTLMTFPNGKPLKDRKNIIITTDESFKVEGAEIVHSTDELLETVEKYDDDSLYVIGGGSIYDQLLPYCDTAHVTKIDFGYEADSYFPNLDGMPEWKITAESDEQTYFDLEYSFVKYERVK